MSRYRMQADGRTPDQTASPTRPGSDSTEAALRAAPKRQLEEARGAKRDAEEPAQDSERAGRR
eukprot:5831821-Amphidinium_carterae.1